MGIRFRLEHREWLETRSTYTVTRGWMAGLAFGKRGLETWLGNWLVRVRRVGVDRGSRYHPSVKKMGDCDLRARAHVGWVMDGCIIDDCLLLQSGKHVRASRRRCCMFTVSSFDRINH
ncbi:hypothetical protein DM02DRAFT_402206 [Periconia macrospinosa]|uniref:Uncharacterized protein n=1 Tax=Periconia macrospinosa TaxID=97972 RepID=A0A2V1DPI0_9PLEO|nr:hypothetical protein DM02DRAFT_402206 [Periconia macrospinosa]